MLTLGQSVLGPGAHLIDRQLRRMNRRLSPLRDLHALVEALDRLRIKARDESTTLVLDRTRRIATRRRGAISRKPEFAQQLQHEQAVLVMLRAALGGLPWESIPASMVIEAMTSAAHKAEAARERAYAHDRAEDWHRWRRHMRRISQQHRAAAATGLADPLRVRQEFDRTARRDAGPEPAGRALRQGLALPQVQPRGATLRRARPDAAAQAHSIRGYAALTALCGWSADRALIPSLFRACFWQVRILSAGTDFTLATQNAHRACTRPIEDGSTPAMSETRSCKQPHTNLHTDRMTTAGSAAIR